MESAKQEPVPLEKRHPPIWWIIRRFQLNVDALREMLTEVAPNIRELDKVRLGPKALAAVNALPGKNQEQLRQFLEDEEAAERERPEEPPEDEPETSEADDEEYGKKLKEIFRGDGFALASFIEGYSQAMAGPSRVSIVQNSLLVMAVSAFEVLISGLAARNFIAFQGALDAEKREFSLRDLEGFKTEGDALDLLLSRRVSKLMYGGLEDWSKWFAAQGDIDVPELAIDWEVVREIFQRRHIITHSGGLVSSEYLARVKLSAPPALGSRLSADEDYLEAAFDQLDALGTGLGVRSWATWLPDQNDQSAAALIRRSYQTLVLGRWRVTEKLAAMEVHCADETRYALRCNGWLSLAERGGYEAIRAEVVEWDVSALSGRFKLVRLVLIQDLDQALAMVPTLLASEELAPGELREWPILRTLREHPDYPAIAEKQGV